VQDALLGLAAAISLQPQGLGKARPPIPARARRRGDAGLPGFDALATRTALGPALTQALRRPSECHCHSASLPRWPQSNTGSARRSLGPVSSKKPGGPACSTTGATAMSAGSRPRFELCRVRRVCVFHCSGHRARPHSGQRAVRRRPFPVFIAPCERSLRRGMRRALPARLKWNEAQMATASAAAGDPGDGAFPMMRCMKSGFGDEICSP
jgi:hypothetical protein